MSKQANETKLPKAPSTGKYRKASDLEQGQSLTGTFIRTHTDFSEKLQKNMTSLVMRDENGREYELTPCGSINDAIGAGQLKPGKTYRFEKEGVEKTKTGQYRNVFGIYEVNNKASGNSEI